MIINWANPPTSVLNAPVYLARARDTLTAEGVEIVATDTANGGEHARALLEGKYDMGHMGLPSLMAALSRTAGYVVVGTGLVRHPPHSMIVPASVKKLQEIQTRPIGINSRGTCSHSILRTLLAREFIDEFQVPIVEMGAQLRDPDSIRKAELAAAILWEPYTTTALHALGWKIFAAGANIWSPSRYCTVIYARRGLVEETPHVVRSVLRSYARWVQTAQLDPQATADQMQREMPGLPAEDIRDAIAREVASWCADTSLDRDLLERAMADLKLQSVLPDDFRLDGAIAPLGP